MSTFTRPDVWLASGVRTPFAKVDGALAGHDAIALSVPVVQAMLAQLGGAQPDFTVWGSVVPNLTWSNLAREVLMEAGAPPTIPAFSTIMACSTSMGSGVCMAPACRNWSSPSGGIHFAATPGAARSTICPKAWTLGETGP